MHSLDFGLYPTDEGHLPGHRNTDSQESEETHSCTYLKLFEKQLILYLIDIYLGKK